MRLHRFIIRSDRVEKQVNLVGQTIVLCGLPKTASFGQTTEKRSSVLLGYCGFWYAESGRPGFIFTSTIFSSTRTWPFARLTVFIGI